MGWNPIKQAVAAVQQAGNSVASTVGQAIGDAASTVTGSNGNNHLEDLANIATNLLTQGLVGYSGGRLNPRAGAITHGIDESLGEITGRNMARDINWQNNQRIDAEQRQREQELVNMQRQAQLDDLAASNAAGKGDLGTLGGRGQGGYNANDMGTFNTDFLGL